MTLIKYEIKIQEVYRFFKLLIFTINKGMYGKRIKGFYYGECAHGDSIIKKKGCKNTPGQSQSIKIKDLC